MDAYKQRQSVALAALLAEDYVITLEDGSTYGRVGFISYTARPLHVDLAELSDVKIHIHENTAVVIAAYHERGALDGKSYDYRDRLTDVWMKIAGKWQLIASHYSLPSNPELNKPATPANLLFPLLASASLLTTREFPTLQADFAPAASPNTAPHLLAPPVG